MDGVHERARRQGKGGSVHREEGGGGGGGALSLRQKTPFRVGTKANFRFRKCLLKKKQEKQREVRHLELLAVASRKKQGCVSLAPPPLPYAPVLLTMGVLSPEKGRAAASQNRRAMYVCGLPGGRMGDSPNYLDPSFCTPPYISPTIVSLSNK